MKHVLCDFVSSLCLYLDITSGIDEHDNMNICEDGILDSQAENDPWQESSPKNSSSEHAETSRFNSMPIAVSSQLIPQSECNRDPTEVLLKIFPYLDPVILRSVLVNCQGNLLKAVEILSPHSMTRLKEVKPNGVQSSEVARSHYARHHLSAFQPPNRFGTQMPCRCCDRNDLMHTQQPCIEKKRYSLLTRDNLHRATDQEIQPSYIDYFFSVQNTTNKYADDLSVSRPMNFERHHLASRSFEAICFECKTPSRPQDMFCRVCGARISKSAN